jgi:hypothetical protein
MQARHAALSRRRVDAGRMSCVPVVCVQHPSTDISGAADARAPRVARRSASCFAQTSALRALRALLRLTASSCNAGKGFFCIVASPHGEDSSAHTRLHTRRPRRLSAATRCTLSLRHARCGALGAACFTRALSAACILCLRFVPDTDTDTQLFGGARNYQAARSQSPSTRWRGTAGTRAPYIAAHGAVAMRELTRTRALRPHARRSPVLNPT